MASVTTAFYFVLFIYALRTNHAVILSSGKATLMQNNTINITIDTKLNVVDIELSILLSTPVVWKAVGFGSISMLGTYAIVVDYTFPGQIPIVIETTLADHHIGTVYTVPEISVQSDIDDGITRTVHIQRPIDGTYSFPTASTVLFNTMSAIGQKSNFQRCFGQRQAGCQHVIGTEGRSTQTLVLKEVISELPTAEPSVEPTISPTPQPTANPTTLPTLSPSDPPSNVPSTNPSISPTIEPTWIPTIEPTLYPTNTPSKPPIVITIVPSASPTYEPTIGPTHQPTISPTVTPSEVPSFTPTKYPIRSPTMNPTVLPTVSPTMDPTVLPTVSPITDPSLYPTFAPTSSDPLTWICDEKAKCKHHVISCDGMNGTYCDLHCISSTSCQYTIFECPSDMHCNIVCDGYKACDSLSVIGRRRGHLNLQCHGDSSCITATVNADHSDTLNVTCVGKQSCNDIALWCPSHTLSDGVFVPHCTISAVTTGDESAVHKMRIYAENSWNDIDQTSYLPLDAEIEMFCHSDASQCVLQQSNGGWNCKDADSLCFISERIETTVSPTKVDVTTESTDEEEEEEESFMLIACDERNPCDTDIICNESECHVRCNAGDSCRSRNIYGTKQNSILSVECNGYGSCKGANLFGDDLLYLMVTCRGYEACKGANFYGNNSKLLNIDCLDIGGSCQDINVFCPLDRKGCVISNDGREGNDIHTNLDFYAVHGFDDLDLSKYDATLISIEHENGTNRMHCGTHYESFCVLNSSLFCKCIADENHFLAHHVTVSEIVAITISGAVLLSIVGLLGLCVYYNKTKTESYAKVKKEVKIEIEMENKELMHAQKDSSEYNAIVVECDNDSDQDLVYGDGDKSEDIKHPKHSLYRKV